MINLCNQLVTFNQSIKLNMYIRSVLSFSRKKIALYSTKISFTKFHHLHYIRQKRYMRDIHLEHHQWCPYSILHPGILGFSSKN